MLQTGQKTGALIDVLPESWTVSLPAYACNPQAGQLLDPLSLYINAWNYAFRVMVVPGSNNAQINPSQSVEDSINIDPGSYLTMITGSSLVVTDGNGSVGNTLGLGFRLQIYDQGAGRAVYSTDVSGQAQSGAGSSQHVAAGYEFDYLGNGFPFGPFILPSPLVVLRPGQLNIKVINLDPVNICDIQVVMFFAVPRSSTPDNSDQELQRERTTLVGKTLVNSTARKS